MQNILRYPKISCSHQASLSIISMARSMAPVLVLQLGPQTQLPLLKAFDLGHHCIQSEVLSKVIIHSFSHRFVNSCQLHPTCSVSPIPVSLGSHKMAMDAVLQSWSFQGIAPPNWAHCVDVCKPAKAKTKIATGAQVQGV